MIPVFAMLSHLRSSSLIVSAILHTFFGVTIAIVAVSVTRRCLAWVPVAVQCAAWHELGATGSTDSSDQTAFSSGPLYIAQSLAWIFSCCCHRYDHIMDIDDTPTIAGIGFGL